VKILIVSLILWIFVVPCAVGMCLIFMFPAGIERNFYFVFTALVVAFVTLAIVQGPLWTRQSSKESSTLSSTNYQQSTALQENQHQKCVEGQLHS
jgi:hypothetical protein